MSPPEIYAETRILLSLGLSKTLSFYYFVRFVVKSLLFFPFFILHRYLRSVELRWDRQPGSPLKPSAANWLRVRCSMFLVVNTFEIDKHFCLFIQIWLNSRKMNTTMAKIHKKIFFSICRSLLSGPGEFSRVLTSVWFAGPHPVGAGAARWTIMNSRASTTARDVPLP